MLLVAQPRSASSSLVKTLAKITGGYGHVNVEKEPDAIYPRKYSEIHKFHTVTCLRPINKLIDWQDDRINFWKEHILPENEGIGKLDKKYIVLLRKVADSVDSYRRFAKDHGLHVNFEKLHKQLEMYQKGWLGNAAIYKNIKIIWYEDLVLKYDKTIKKITRWYGIKPAEEYPELEKLHYTPVGRKRLLTKQKETDIINHDQSISDG